MSIKKTTLLILFVLISAILCNCAVFNTMEKPPAEPIQIKPTATPHPIQSAVPTPSPEYSPTTSAIPTPKPIEFTILATGDVMTHGDNLKSAYNTETGNYSFDENYIHVKKIIEKADFALCNLETVTAGEESGYTSYPLFNTPAAILDGLKFAGFNALVTANNHSLDRGEAGILNTLSEIKKREMLSIGTYSEKNTNYLTIDIKGIQVSILAYTQHLNGNLPMLSEDKYFMVNQMDKGKITDDIKAASLHSDLVLVYLHWGNEYTRGTEDWQPAYAYDLIEAGADVILGTHPHVVRPDEVVLHNGEAKYIIYSMGNFISNFIREDNRNNAIYTEDGVMINMIFIVNESGGVELTEVIPVPTWPYKYTDKTGIHYEIIPVENADSIVHVTPYADNEAKESYERTMESLAGYKASH